MRALVAALGNPERQVPIIHIAGTNGKGSVAAMLESILRSAGWKPGLYTSPHLVRLNERVQVNRVLISDAELAAGVRELATVVAKQVAEGGEAMQPSYFEFMTGLAFSTFAQSRCDVAIVEVGMGGRLDATNVVMPEVSVITSIGLDHTEFLGDTIEAVSREKAGIIKPNRPVVIGRLPPMADRVVHDMARLQRAPVHTIGGKFGDDVQGYPRTNLAGPYQRLNAATAALAASVLDARWRIDDAAIERGLMNVSWPGRWERFDIADRTVIVDASHNEEGAVALDQNLALLTKTTTAAPTIVIGVLGENRAKPLLEAASRYAGELRLVIPNQSRACSYEQLERLVPQSFRGRVLRTTLAEIFPAPNVCLPSLSREVPVVVTGSIYLAGEVLARIDPTRGPVEEDLQDF